VLPGEALLPWLPERMQHWLVVTLRLQSHLQVESKEPIPAARLLGAVLLLLRLLVRKRCSAAALRRQPRPAEGSEVPMLATRLPGAALLLRLLGKMKTPPRIGKSEVPVLVLRL